MELVLGVAVNFAVSFLFAVEATPSEGAAFNVFDWWDAVSSPLTSIFRFVFVLAFSFSLGFAFVVVMSTGFAPDAAVGTAFGRTFASAFAFWATLRVSRAGLLRAYRRGMGA